MTPSTDVKGLRSGEEGSRVLRLLFLTSHLAPYNLPVLSLVHGSGKVKIEAAVQHITVPKHNYWPEMRASFPVHELPADDRPRERESLARLEVLLRSGAFDVVAVSGYNEPLQRKALLHCLWKGRPFIWMIDSILQTHRSLLKRSLKWAPIRYVVSRMGAAWVPGAATRDYLLHYGAAEDKIFQGCYCLDAESLRVGLSSLGPERERYRGQLGLSRDSFAFLFIGRMIPERGLPHLMRAFDSVQSRHPEARLILVGTGPERPWVENFIAEHRLSSVHVFDPVPVNDLALFYVASDCYVHPSVSETYSLTTAHAAIAGLPLIVTDQVGAFMDYLVEGGNGYLVRAANDDALANGMQRMLGAPVMLRVAMGARSLQLALPRTAGWAASQLEAAVATAYGRT
jgi:glycosyltransferase involved in cell wall biosynthesis